jgi:hypothetical protein
MEPEGMGSMGMGSMGEGGMTSEPESSGTMGSGSSERIKIGERPPEQTWPGGR